MAWIVKYWKTLTITACILLLSFARIPELDPQPKINNLDKLVHFSMYFILTLVLMQEYNKDDKSIKSKLMFFTLCIVLPLSLGAFTELVQANMIIYRGGDWYDMLSNSLGVFTAWAIFAVFKKT